MPSDEKQPLINNKELRTEYSGGVGDSAGGK